MKIRPRVWTYAQATDRGYEPVHGDRYIRTLDRSTGATTLAPVEIVNDLADDTPAIMPGECEHPPVACYVGGTRDSMYFGCHNCGTAGPSRRLYRMARRAFLDAFPPANMEVVR